MLGLCVAKNFQLGFAVSDLELVGKAASGICSLLAVDHFYSPLRIMSALARRLAADSRLLI